MFNSDSLTNADAQLHIVGSETADHTVSVDVLARTLTGLQQTVLLLATLLEGRPVQGRLKTTKIFRQRYGLRCGARQPGTVNVPLMVGEHLSGRGLIEEPVQVLNQIYQLLDALGNQSEQIVNDILPDPISRGRVLDSVYEFLPKSDDRWSLGFAMLGRREVRLGRASAEFTQKLRQMSRERVTIVAGRVVAIDDTKRRVTIDASGVKRELRGLYPVDLEDILLQNFKKPVHIVGLYGLDIDGDPVTLNPQ